MNTKTMLPALALLLGATGCALPTMKAISATPVAAETARSPVPNQARPVSTLYARDGSVVAGPEPGATAITPVTGQTALSDGGTRWTLLEQYQSALSEKEQLQFELEAMAKALEQAESQEVELQNTVSGLRVSVTEATERMQTLEGHNVELAARLTTAQIRRLQSEKLLLEAKLDWRRIQAAINAPASLVSGEEPQAGAATDSTGSADQ